MRISSISLRINCEKENTFTCHHESPSTFGNFISRPISSVLTRCRITLDTAYAPPVKQKSLLNVSQHMSLNTSTSAPSAKDVAMSFLMQQKCQTQRKRGDDIRLFDEIDRTAEGQVWSSFAVREWLMKWYLFLIVKL